MELNACLIQCHSGFWHLDVFSLAAAAKLAVENKSGLCVLHSDKAALHGALKKVKWRIRHKSTDGKQNGDFYSLLVKYCEANKERYIMAKMKRYACVSGEIIN